MLSEKVIRVYTTPPSRWSAMLSDPPGGRGFGEGIDETEWEKIADELEESAIRMLLLSEYISRRCGGYWGNRRSHAVAAKCVSKRQVALRRALGFLSPKEGPLRL